MQDVSPFDHRSTSQRVRRLDRDELAMMREQRLNEIRMWSVLREISASLLFLGLLFIVAYAHVNPAASQQVHHLRRFVLNSRSTDSDFGGVRTIDDYWHWLHSSFVGNMRAQRWYNGDAPRNLSGFVDDKANRLIGWVTMRQLRMPPSACATRQVSSQCTDDYSMFSEQRTSFLPSGVSSIAYNASVLGAFVYRSPAELGTHLTRGEQHTYAAGGYVFEFRGRLSDLHTQLEHLHDLQWIDGSTRAVVIQLSVYNANCRLFTFVTLLAEFLRTGGVRTLSRFEPIDLHGMSSLHLHSHSRRSSQCSVR